MKNHIKNYIKILGLAAVPFGTAQADNHTIRVIQEERPDAMHFKISISGGEIPLYKTEIVWSHDKDYPNPLLYPSVFQRCYDDENQKEGRVHDGPSLDLNGILNWVTFFKKWRDFYDVNSV